MWKQLKSFLTFLIFLIFVLGTPALVQVIFTEKSNVGDLVAYIPNLILVAAAIAVALYFLRMLWAAVTSIFRVGKNLIGLGSTTAEGGDDDERIDGETTYTW